MVLNSPKRKRQKPRTTNVYSVSMDHEASKIWNANIRAGINMSAWVQEQVKYHHTNALSPDQKEKRLREEMLILEKVRDEKIEAIQAEYEPHVRKAWTALNAMRDHIAELEAGR